VGVIRSLGVFRFWGEEKSLCEGERERQSSEFGGIPWANRSYLQGLPSSIRGKDGVDIRSQEKEVVYLLKACYRWKGLLGKDLIHRKNVMTIGRARPPIWRREESKRARARFPGKRMASRALFAGWKERARGQE